MGWRTVVGKKRLPASLLPVRTRVQTVLPDLRQQRAAGDTEQMGCSPLVAAGVGQSTRDMPSLYIIKRLRFHRMIGSQRFAEHRLIEPRSGQRQHGQVQSGDRQRLGSLTGTTGQHRQMTGSPQRVQHRVTPSGIGIQNQNMRGPHELTPLSSAV